jgi:hypothetical protein
MVSEMWWLPVWFRVPETVMSEMGCLPVRFQVPETEVSETMCLTRAVQCEVNSLFYEKVNADALGKGYLGLQDS